jgi:hypothetical protein
MATTMDNLEKLIQMATIEQMYNMLQKMNNNNNVNNCFMTDNKTINEQVDRIEGVCALFQTDTRNHIDSLYNMVNKLSVKINEIETELQDLKQSTVKQVSGQQTLDKYFNKQEPIRIDINVIQQEEFTEEQLVKLEGKEVWLEEATSKDFEDASNVERKHEDTYDDAFTNLIVEPEEQVVEPEEQDESSVEDEVVTDDDAEQPTQPQPTVEEEEEVFEIEIDDVTYYATSEENGILYEVLSDGDAGKNVGIIKDGEPIFN